MDSKTSEIENTIKKSIEEETSRNVMKLTEIICNETKASIDRINGVYASAINTLKQLELTDATIFDFFQKTGGNIRVYDGLNTCSGSLNVDLPGGNALRDYNPIRLKEKTKYKIIVMAMEIKEEPK